MPQIVGRDNQKGIAHLVRQCLLLVVSVLSLAACTAEDTSRTGEDGLLLWTDGAVAWDTDPSTVIVMLYSPYTTAGLSGAYDHRYYVPEAQVRGDGRIIWVRQEGQGRRILEGRLTSEQMEALLRRIVEAGFFEWDVEYKTLGGNSSPPMHLRVNLEDRVHEVSVHGGAPDAYYDLERELLNGAGASGYEFAPSRGYLTAEPFPGGVEAPQWPEGARVTPDMAMNGRYIDGEALAFAWAILNRNPTAPVYVRYGGEVYIIMVQVPGVSYFEPPVPPD